MANSKYDIRIYGAERCHKSRFYKDYFANRKLDFTFLDVEQDETAAKELRSLYRSGKLNFPTLLIDGKKLRNPRSYEIEKCLNRSNL